ncbi:bifunctional helix-turn-helix transcriptional regulator/GNAT family N-acetyltransferase [uncultured Tateyamaria sp.]|uniref:bifunctional helix-turn-helix transcriptional regulator/GNAT family N-acetyltransferase n=1 Tax=uncultured Tateyamaria sp. TaxID=455651 RepID=UPI00262008F5|nr:bifunctional helix-turn-helix transcriptional regulator/GNAT family N-acetyltransferase [uncultured Tateyamaria sp.]
MKASTATDIERIRAASRRLVRELGFMEQTLAGTNLSPSAVHALIEIAEGRATTARDLSDLLRLEKSSVSRLLKKLIETGDVVETQDENDFRIKRLTLTTKGRDLFAAIAKSAQTRVGQAIAPLADETVRTLIDGLEGYAEALARSRSDNTAPDEPEIAEGYRPTLLARVVEMHAHYYSGLVGFGLPFETKVASELAEFMTRLDAPTNGIWHVASGGRISASIAIDGQDLEGDIAHLRWFIVDVTLRGTGIGKRLLDAAIAFCDAQGFSETHLWTFQGLDTARALYERVGFELAEEKAGRQWGADVIEQRFVRIGQLD